MLRGAAGEAPVPVFGSAGQNTKFMPDVFLSYSREDQATARRFAEAFERAGFSVWWDQTLRSGQAYDRVTERALKEAKAVVVLWSRHSVESRWVRAEATIADRAGTLIPAMIEPCDRPVMFELTQTAELADWDGNEKDAAWQAYVADVGQFVRGEDAAPSSRVLAAPMKSTTRGTRRWDPIHVMIVLASVLPIVLLGWWLFRDRTPAAAPQPPPVATPTTQETVASIAVLPFTNLTGDAEKEYFGDGMAEELINALSKVPGLKVASRTSSFVYKGKNADIRQIAKDLRVSTVLEGSVRGAGDRVRINAQLTNADSGYQVWNESYERDFKDLFALQDDLARQIVAAFQRTSGSRVGAFESQGPPTKDLEAYRRYLQAIASFNRGSSTSINQAISLLEQATARDPEFAVAYLTRAIYRNNLSQPVRDIDQDMQRAIELDPRLAPDANLLRAGLLGRQGKWVEAEEIIEASAREGFVSLNLGSPGPLSTWWPTGRLRNSITAFENAYAGAPAAGGTAMALGIVYAAAERYADAERVMNDAVALGVDPGARRAASLRASLDVHRGNFTDAARNMKLAFNETGRGEEMAPLVDQVYAAMADASKRPAAVAAVQSLLPSVSPPQWVIKVWAMNWLSQLGRPDLALEVGDQLRLQFREESPGNAWSWLWGPEQRAMRQLPEFSDFTKRLGMFPYWKKYGPPDNCEVKNDQLVCR